MAFCQAMRDGISLTIRLTPKGGRDALGPVARLADGSEVLAARVAAAPHEGAANAALLSLVAKAFAVPKSAVGLASGQTGRIKRLTIAGDPTTLTAAARRLAEAA